MFREDKATALAHVFLRHGEGSLNDLKLMKLMYLAERKSLGLFTATITGSRFHSMRFGPVLSDAYEVMKGAVPASIWSETIRFQRYRDGATENTFEIKVPLEPSEYLSEAEIEIADEVWAEYGSRGKWNLVDLTHEFPEWDRRAEALNTSFELRLATIFERAFQKPQDEIDEYVSTVEQFSGSAF